MNAVNINTVISGYSAVALTAMLFAAASSFGQSEIDGPPINYSTSKPTDAISRLNEEIQSGQTKLNWDETHGWLPAVLDALNVPQSSQTLVFSKTSLQLSRIQPSRPRAIYFNDDIYIGWVQGGDIVEVAAVDVNLGATFYSLAQEETKRPTFVRDRGNCLSCHHNSRTENVPGFLVRSLYTESSGQPAYQLGSVTIDHTTPFKDRFGGWYVTGKHGSMRHRGNVMVADDSEDPIDREAGANLLKLPNVVNRDAYIRADSDIVAQMVLQHQTQMHNFVTKALYASKQAMHQQLTMNRILDRPDDFKSESTTRRINSAVEDLVEYMFFCEEFQLESPVEGSDEFRKSFLAMGPRDSHGRSLRDFDLRTRLFKYPCSYLAYSESLLALPKPVLARLKERMLDVLAGEDDSKTFAHLSVKDRRNILAILAETHPLFKDVDVERPLQKGN